MDKQLMFGLGWAIPAPVTTAWGARWIFPSDMVWDRQSNIGPDFEPLKAWLNAGALSKAKNAAHKASGLYYITPDSSDKVILFQDETGVIVGSPNASYGYLYVAAWLHNGIKDRMPSPDFTPIRTARKAVKARRKSA